MISFHVPPLAGQLEVVDPSTSNYFRVGPGLSVTILYGLVVGDINVCRDTSIVCRHVRCNR